MCALQVVFIFNIKHKTWYTDLNVYCSEWIGMPALQFTKNENRLGLIKSKHGKSDQTRPQLGLFGLICLSEVEWTVWFGIYYGAVAGCSSLQYNF